MSQTFTYTKAHKLSLLHDQLLAAGVAPSHIEGIATDIRVTVADGVAKAAVDAVVTAHDAAVLSAAEAGDQAEVADRSDLVAQYAAGMARLDAIVTDGPTYTQTQARDAIVDLARIQRRVLRLVRSARL